MLSQNKNVNEDFVYQTLGNRVENILKFASLQNKKTLILGAWGCGVFGLDSCKTSSIFKEKINEGWYSGEINFCIPDKKLLDTFKINIL